MNKNKNEIIQNFESTNVYYIYCYVYSYIKSKKYFSVKLILLAKFPRVCKNEKPLREEVKIPHSEQEPILQVKAVVHIGTDSSNIKLLFVIYSLVCSQGQYIGGRKVVTSRSAPARLELYCHDLAKNCTVQRYKNCQR